MKFEMVKTFKMPFQTRHFNENQRVWVRNLTGDMAAECVGRFRGRHRYVSAWVRWGNKVKPIIKEMEVDQQFAQMING